MTIRTSISLQGLTWQDLYDFTDLARAAGVPGGRNVTVVDEESLDDTGCPERLEVELDGPVASQVHIVLETDAKDFRLALDTVIEEDGDARAVMPILEGLRTALT